VFLKLSIDAEFATEREKLNCLAILLKILKMLPENIIEMFLM